MSVADEQVLAGLGVGRLVVAGAQTDQCVRCTLHGALARGDDVALVSDAHTTCGLTEWGAPPPEQVIPHTRIATGPPGRRAVSDRRFVAAAPEERRS